MISNKIISDTNLGLINNFKPLVLFLSKNNNLSIKKIKQIVINAIIFINNKNNQKYNRIYSNLNNLNEKILEKNKEIINKTKQILINSLISENDISLIKLFNILN